MIPKITTALAIFLLIGFLANSQSTTFIINLSDKAQQIENFGASGAWYSEGIGKYWPAAKKERMAELLFSKGFDKNGNPLGIGLSAWRFNIGGGTAEQGDSSGISDPLRRVEGFLSSDGTYNWNKQSGYVWFVKKAAQYKVEDLIAFSNTPPVQFTKNGLGFKTEKNYEANLKEDQYTNYANFLAKVLQHFEKAGTVFRYISPVNEPQWDWSAKFGEMNQEGSPWHNRDIFKISTVLDSVLRSKKMSTKMLITEAGDLHALYEGQSRSGRQIQDFYNPASDIFVGNLKQMHKVIEGHSYFTEAGDSNMIAVRKKVLDTASTYKVPFWQSEYCMLSNGYKDGKKGKIDQMDCALFLAKVIYHDLTIANATAWHYWNAWEPGDSLFDTRYYLLALKINPGNTDGDFAITKNLWALGHFSRFIRPGMHRIITKRSDGLNELQAAKDVMLAAFADEKQIVITAINYAEAAKEIKLDMPGIKKKKGVRYVTTAAAADNLTKYSLPTASNILLEPRSITTIVLGNQ